MSIRWLQVSVDEAARVRRREVGRLLSSRRLVLILDLDHTLLHSVRLSEVRSHAHSAALPCSTLWVGGARLCCVPPHCVRLRAVRGHASAAVVWPPESSLPFVVS